jgi:hypothetical protein
MERYGAIFVQKTQKEQSLFFEIDYETQAPKTQ